MSVKREGSIYSRMSARKGFWIVTSAVIVVDQISKLIAQLTLKPSGWESGDPSPVYPFIDGLIDGTWAHGNLAQPTGPGAMPVMMMGIAVIFWIAVFYGIGFHSGPRRHVLRVGGGLLLGGMLSNLCETLLTGHIRNFMRMGFDNPLWSRDGNTDALGPMYAQHPSFSLASVTLVLGMSLLIVGAFLGKPKSS